MFECWKKMLDHHFQGSCTFGFGAQVYTQIWSMIFHYQRCFRNVVPSHSKLVHDVDSWYTYCMIGINSYCHVLCIKKYVSNDTTWYQWFYTVLYNIIQYCFLLYHIMIQCCYMYNILLHFVITFLYVNADPLDQVTALLPPPPLPMLRALKIILKDLNKTDLMV